MLDVTIADLIDYFGSRTETQSIILYIESITEAREFMSAARAFARTKPIVAYKAGRFAESAAAAASHTGAMAGVDAVYEAAFQRAGIERIFQIEDMFDCAELLARQQPPKGDRVAIVTYASSAELRLASTSGSRKEQIKIATGYTGLGYLIIAHTAFCIPFAYLPIRARLEGMDLTLETAAADLYAAPLRDDDVPVLTDDYAPVELLVQER